MCNKLVQRRGGEGGEGAVEINPCSRSGDFDADGRPASKGLVVWLSDDQFSGNCKRDGFFGYCR